MDFKIFIITLLLGYMGTVVIGNCLNMPDGGAIVAIAFVGGCVIKNLKNKER